MRYASFAVLAALAFGAYAQDNPEIAPRVRVPGESAIQRELAVTPAFLESIGMLQDDLASVQQTVKKLNDQRATLLEQLAKAQTDLKAAQKKVDDVIAELNSQKAILHKFIQDRLPGDQRADYPIRVQLQPVIDWLKLTSEQASELIAKQRELLAADPRAELAQASRGIQQRAPGERMTADERKAHIELLKRCSDFNQTWLKNIESVLTTDEQKNAWKTRYRRTLYPLGSGM